MKGAKWMLACAMLAVVGFGASSHASIIDEWASVKAPPAPPLRSVTVDPKTTALLMLDFIKPICNQQRYPRCLATLPAVKKLLDEARAHDMLVVYTGVPKVPISAVVPEVAAKGTEPYMQSFLDKFLRTDLEKVLKDKGIETVISVGVAAQGAVLTTSSEAAQRGFNVIVPVDGLSAQDTYYEQYSVWHLSHAPVIADHIALTSIDMIKFAPALAGK